MAAEGTTLAITVRSTDMDADRTVNNAVYFQYFEQSRLEHLLRLGVIRWPPARGGDPPQFALAETTARFRAPAFHREVLIVTTRTTAVGTRSFTLGFEVRRRGDDALICEGSSVQVWLDAEGRAAPLPQDVRATLEASLSPRHDQVH
jgi:acyl-CoA thioester hydrolase